MKRATIVIAFALAACAHPAPAPVTPDYRAIVAAADRTPADQALDAGRHPTALLELAQIQPGMRVAELAAGGGYTTELLARAVAPNGIVYAQNPELFVKFIGEAWPNRLARPINQNVVGVELPMESPLPPEAKDLDVVIVNLVYHDFVWMDVDRDKMNQVIFEALKPGGSYVIVDHSAIKGHGLDDVKTFHRIDEDTLIAELTKAGFTVDGTSDAWRTPDDTRDWSASPSQSGEKRGTSDRFAIRFIKRKP